MKDIVLVSINARYSHAGLGVRCLLANMGGLRSRTVLEEFVIQDSPRGIAERILAHEPRIVGMSLAIWNVSPALKVNSAILNPSWLAPMATFMCSIAT